MEIKIDPYKHGERYLRWKESVQKGIPEISQENSKAILHYLQDMEIGVNIASVSVKGARGYGRLNTLKDKLIFNLELNYLFLAASLIFF